MLLLRLPAPNSLIPQLRLRHQPSLLRLCLLNLRIRFQLQTLFSLVTQLHLRMNNLLPLSTLLQYSSQLLFLQMLSLTIRPQSLTKTLNPQLLLHS
jgi:hypothetical protein